jgi:histidinol-phosphatase (PHP family)
MLTNYHSHTNYCDGSSNIEEYVLEAIHLGLSTYGFSSHAPLPFACQWSMPISQLQDYSRRIDYLKDKWKDEIVLLKSLEIDYIPGVAGPKNSLFNSLNLDYTIGSIHFLDYFPDGKPWGIDDSHRKFEMGLQEIFYNDIQLVVSRYYEYMRKMLVEEAPTILGHFDKIKMHNSFKVFFNEKDMWYQNEVEKTLREIIKSGTFVEVNTRGYYKGKTHNLYPSHWILSLILEYNIPIVVNSDAHMPSEICEGYAFAFQELKGLGFKSVMNFKNGIWVEDDILEIESRLLEIKAKPIELKR